MGVFISRTLGVVPSPEGKELGESEESLSPYRRSVFTPNMDSDYHSLSNAPISPGRVELPYMV